MALWIVLCAAVLAGTPSTLGHTQYPTFSSSFNNFESSRTIPHFVSSSSSLSSSSLSSPTLPSPSFSSSSLSSPSSSTSSLSPASSASSSSISQLPSTSSSRFGSSLFNANNPFPSSPLASPSSPSSRNAFVPFGSSVNSFRTNEFASPFDAFQNVNRQPHTHHRQASHYPGSIVTNTNTNPQSQFSQFVSRDTPHQSDESKWKFHFAFHNNPNDNAHSTTSAHFQSAFTDDDDDGEADAPLDNESGGLQRDGRQIIGQSFAPKTNVPSNNMQNIVIPLPSHHFKDRSSGMIVISQDEGAFAGRDASNDDSSENGRQFHYELLTSTNSQTVTTEPTAPNKRETGDDTSNGSEVSRTSDETVGDSESTEEDVTDGHEEKENRVNENGRPAAVDNSLVSSTPDSDPASAAAAAQSDHNTGGADNVTKNTTSNNQNNNIEQDNNNSLAAAFTFTMAHDNDDKKVKGQKRKFSSVADFISSKVAARIHLSRPKSSVNITLTHAAEMNGGSSKSADKVKSKFNRFNTSPTNGDRASVLLLLESETLRNKKPSRASKNDHNLNDHSIDTAQISRSRRRQQSDNSGQNLLNDRKKNKAPTSTTSTTTSTTTTSTTSTTTEQPEVSTTLASLDTQNDTNINSTSQQQTVLNTLVKEFNLALNDKIRQLENINETMMSMFGGATPDETTITPTTMNEPSENGNNLQMSITTTTEVSTTADEQPEVDITTVSSDDSAEEHEQTTTVTSLTMDIKDSSLTESTTTTTTNTIVEMDNSNTIVATTTKTDNDTIVSLKEVTTVPAITTTDDPIDTDNTTIIPSTTTTTTTTTTSTTLAPTTTTAAPTTTTTTSTTTPAPKSSTTSTTTTRAPVTAKPKRETQPKTGKNHKTGKANKKSHKSGSKAAQKPSKSGGSGGSSLKLKMNVTLPIHRPENDDNRGQSHRRPALQLALGISSSTPDSDHKSDTGGDFDDLPIIVERRAPSTPRIPNNFGFSNEVVESFHVPVRNRQPKQPKAGSSSGGGSQRRASSKHDGQNSHSHSQALFSIVPSTDDDNEDNRNNDESVASRFVRLAQSPSSTTSTTTTTTTTSTTTTPAPVDESFEDMNDSDNSNENDDDNNKHTKDDNGDDDDDDDDGDDSQSQNPEANVPGTAGVDYPVLSNIPDTGFDCAQQKYPGFYSDMSVGCQVYHSCSLAAIRARPRRREPEIEDDAEAAASSHAYSYAESRTVPRKISAASTRNIHHGNGNNPGMNGNGGRHHSFLCPNGTIFSQEYLICDWWYNVKCDQSPKFYPLNRDVYSSGLVAATLPAQSNSNSVQSPVASSSNHKPLLVSAGGVRLHATTYRSSSTAAAASSQSVRPLLSHQQASSALSTTNRHFASYYSN